jgi:hypothetical protein
MTRTELGILQRNYLEARDRRDALAEKFSRHPTKEMGAELREAQQAHRTALSVYNSAWQSLRYF